MKGRPQMRVTPSVGVFFNAPSFPPRALTLSELVHFTQGESKGSSIQGLLEAIARLLGFPALQPIPVKVRR